MLVSGDEEYRSEEALSQLGKILAVRQPGGKTKQLDAICNFASKHVATDTAVFLTVWKGDKDNYKSLKRALVKKTVERHTLLILYSATKK